MFGFDIGSSNAASLRGNATWTGFAAGIAASADHWEILGFTDCEGGVERNTQLREDRAKAVLHALPATAQSLVDGASAAALSDCVASNDTEANRAFNRSVAFRRTMTSITFGDQPVTGLTCPPKTGAGATTLADYIALLACAEAQTGFGPRDMLAMLRQIYYGKPWSTVSNTNKWDNVIPCSPNLGDPSSKLGADLFHALGAADEIEGVDVSHVFTGLEAMTCPSSNVQFFAGLATVDMSNEEFATWGGDLGAAAAATAACPALGADAAASEDCGNKAGSQPLSFYWAVSAPSQDLEGDIDAFVIRAALLGVPCSGSAGKSFTPTDPISQTFAKYYIDATSALGAARPNSHRCLLEILGATLSGKTVTNRSAIKPPIVPRVASFAMAFYTKIVGGLSTPDMGERILIRDNSDTVTDLFLDYLISKL